jgi:heme exporter protein B
MLKIFGRIIYYEILTVKRQAMSWLTPLVFFVLVVCLFPLAIGDDIVLLQKIAPGVIWVAALLAIIISLGNLFRIDADNGYLDNLVLSPHSLTLIVLAKIISHWLTHCLPLILISPLLGYLLGLPPQVIWILMLSLLLGTPVLNLLGAVGAALVISVGQNSLLLPILIMPLYIPVLIFGTSTVTAATIAAPLGGYFAILAALSLLSLAFAPLLTSIALRIGVTQ